MKSTLFLLALGSIALVEALPAPRPLRSYIRARATGPSVHSRQQAGLPGIGDGPAAAPDGTPILEDEVTINGLPIRFKISAPSEALVAGAAAGSAAQGNAANNRRQAADLGINVLFHGDGGQSFFDFPNAGVTAGRMGVALLSPDPQLRWGGFDPQDQTGLVRPDGEAHSAAVNSFLTKTLPGLVNFDPAQIFMEGVSGGSLMLSGFTIPQFGASLKVPGVVFGCGGLAPQVDVAGDISQIRVHWQSSQDDLPALQTSIPQSIAAYQQLATDSGLSDTEINQLQTADNSPNGGHCEFDEKDFVTGVQLLTDNYSDIIDGDAQLNGVQVTNGVVGLTLQFAGAAGANAAAGAAANNAAGGKGKAKAAAANNAAAAAGGNAAAATNANAGGNNNADLRTALAAQIAALQRGGRK